MLAIRTQLLGNGLLVVEAAAFGLGDLDRSKAKNVGLSLRANESRIPLERRSGFRITVCYNRALSLLVRDKYAFLI